MARKFHRKDRLSALNEINVTPLIDLAFALLIIFMITTPLLEQTIAVDLPLESVNPQPQVRDEFQSISIDGSGAYFWGDEKVTSLKLADLLETMSMNPDPPVISIRADSGLPYQKVITLIDIIKQHDLSRISFTRKSSRVMRKNNPKFSGIRSI